MLAALMDIVFLFVVFKIKKLVKKLLTFKYNEYILIRFRFSEIYLGGLG